MKILRQADASGVARANAEVARKEAQSKAAQVNHERRELNRRLAEKLVGGWSAHEYRAKFDDELALVLDGKHNGVFNISADKYTRQITVKAQSFGADANAATAATEQRTKQRMASFHSIRWNGESK